MADYPAIDLFFTDPHSPGGPDDDLTDRIYVVLDDYEPLAIQEAETADRWRVFFRSAAVRDKAAAAILAALPAQLVDVKSVDVPDEDWARRSQQNLQPVRAGRLVIAPPWNVPKSGDTPVIIIEPSTGFGTGHHATTRLCLEILQQLELRGARVIDVGTGSGVLAIAASLLGAVNVRGIDDDEDAIHAAWDNLALNPAAIVTLLVGDLRTTELEPADIVFGNLTGGLLMASAAPLAALARTPHGRLILSGFQLPEEQDVVASFTGFTVESREQEDDWVCVTLKHRS